jgi:hypothetical protein
MKKLLGLGLVLLMGCTSLTPERVSLLAAIAGQAAQIGAANWLIKHPDQRPAFDAVILALTALVQGGVTDQRAYVEVLNSLPTATLAGPEGAVYVTDALVVYDFDSDQPTRIKGAAEVPVRKAVIAGLKRGMAPKPPLPGKLKYKPQ